MAKKKLSDRDYYNEIHERMDIAEDDDEEIDRLSDEKADLITYTKDRSIVEEQWGDTDFYMNAVLRRSDVTEEELLKAVDMYEFYEPTAAKLFYESKSFTPKVEAALTEAHPDWRDDLKWSSPW